MQTFYHETKNIIAIFLSKEEIEDLLKSKMFIASPKETDDNTIIISLEEDVDEILSSIDHGDVHEFMLNCELSGAIRG